MTDLLGVVPPRPVEYGEVLERFPYVRQSTLAKFDDCELAALFAMKYENGWSTHPQARGMIFHRVAAQILRVMREQDHEQIPIGAALEILEETLYQRNVEPGQIVRVPFRELPMLEMAVAKFAKDNTFTVRNIIDVERRLAAVLTYERLPGVIEHRTLTGQLDALIARPPDEAVVLDWKDTWDLPPEREEDSQRPGLSYHGYFQQQFYAWLVMSVYPAVNAVTLREFYVRRTKARPARVTRDELPKVAQRLRYLVAAFDRALMAGEPPAMLTVDRLDRHGSWKPSPGHHCRWCAKAIRCPVDDDYKDGGVRTPEDASRLAAARAVAKAVVKKADTLLQPWADEHGPIPLKRAKGKRVLGYRTIAGGRKKRWEEFTPTVEEELPPRNPNLEAAMREATERARQARERSKV